jgi:hypothetical protein
LRRSPPSDVLTAWSEGCRVVGAAHPPGGWSRSTVFGGGARFASFWGILGHLGAREPAGLPARSLASIVALPEAAPIDVLAA